MKIAVIGASGFVGEKIVLEALQRKHFVEAIFRRNPITKQENLNLHKLTIFDEDIFEKTIAGVDLVISAYNPGYYHVDQKNRYVDAYKVIFKLCKKLKKRIIVVIGATSLIQYDGELVKNGLVYPKPWIKALEGPDLVYDLYKDDKSVDITFVSPPVELIDGLRTTKYGYGNDHLIYDKNYESRVSVQDLAHAIIDEAENPKYQGKRFTIAYQE